MFKPKKITTLLWDVDGVFVDTEKLQFEAWNEALRPFGKKLTLEEYTPLIGGPGVENSIAVCRIKKVDCDPETLRKQRRALYEGKKQNGFGIIEDNVKLAKKFASAFPELRQAVVSSAQHKDIDENLAAAGLDGLFDLAVSYEDHPELKRKPAPDMYLYALKQLGAKAEECVAFEDSMNGVLAARGAGIVCVALPNKLTTLQDLSAANLVIPFGAERTPERILNGLGLL